MFYQDYVELFKKTLQITRHYKVTILLRICSSFKLTNFKWSLTLFDEKDEDSATHKRKD